MAIAKQNMDGRDNFKDLTIEAIVRAIEERLINMPQPQLTESQHFRGEENEIHCQNK